MFWPFLLGAALGAVAGYALARRRFGTQGAGGFFDPEELAELSQMGHAAVALRIARRKARIMEKARAQGRIGNDDVEDMFCISDGTAGNYLRALAQEGQLERHGSGRGTHYTPTRQV